MKKIIIRIILAVVILILIIFLILFLLNEVPVAKEINVLQSEVDRVVERYPVLNTMACGLVDNGDEITAKCRGYQNPGSGGNHILILENTIEMCFVGQCQIYEKPQVSIKKPTYLTIKHENNLYKVVRK